MSDELRTKFYLLNGIICDFFDANILPSLQDIKQNWQYEYNKLSFNDSDILNMINKVRKFY